MQLELPSLMFCLILSDKPVVNAMQSTCHLCWLSECTIFPSKMFKKPIFTKLKKCAAGGNFLLITNFFMFNRNLQYLLDYPDDGDFADTFGLNFQVSFTAVAWKTLERHVPMSLCHNGIIMKSKQVLKCILVLRMSFLWSNIWVSKVYSVVLGLYMLLQTGSLYNATPGIWLA